MLQMRGTGVHGSSVSSAPKENKIQLAELHIESDLYEENDEDTDEDRKM